MGAIQLCKTSANPLRQMPDCLVLIVFSMCRNYIVICDCNKVLALSSSEELFISKCESCEFVFSTWELRLQNETTFIGFIGRTCICLLLLLPSFSPTISQASRQ